MDKIAFKIFQLESEVQEYVYIYVYIYIKTFTWITIVINFWKTWQIDRSKGKYIAILQRFSTSDSDKN